MHNTTIERYWPVLITVILGSFISIYNICSMNVALPGFISIFHSNLGTVQWLMTGFTLAAGVIMPLSGYLGNRYSNKKVFLYSVLGLMLSSILCSLAWSIYALIVFRLIQGIFCGLIQPVSLTIIYQIIPRNKQTMAVSLWSASSILGPALAPTISGWLLEHNWHWMFLVLVPVCLFTLVIGWRLIPLQRLESFTKLDYLGLLFAIVGSITLLFLFGKIYEWGWSSSKSLIFLTIGILSCWLFIRRELRVKEPLLQLRLFKNRVFTVSLAASVVLIVSLYSGMYFIPLYLQEIHQMTPYHVGLLLLLPALTLGGATVIAGKLYDRFGPFQLVMIGAALIVLASWKFSYLTADTSYSYVAFWMAIRYIGIGLSMTPAMNAGMQAVSKELYGHASALINWLRQIFGALALGMFTSIFYARMNTHTLVLQHSSTLQSSQWIHSTAYVLSINDAFLIAAAISLIGLPLSLFLRNPIKITKNSVIKSV